MKTLNSQRVSLFSVVLALILVIGLVFENLIPGKIIFSYVTPSPAEGLLVFLFLVYGFRQALLVLFMYLGLLFVLKGLSDPLGIGFVALFISALITILVFRFFYQKFKRNFWKSAFVTILINTLFMTWLNAYFILPSYLGLGSIGKWINYKTIFPQQSFFEILSLVVKPLPVGGGILHGSIIKYFMVFWLAHLTYKLTFINKNRH